MKMKNNKNQEFIDDGHTIYDMNVDASWNNRREKSPSVMVSKDERRILDQTLFKLFKDKVVLKNVYYVFVDAFGKNKEKKRIMKIIKKEQI
jgi:hypothetical protein